MSFNKSKAMRNAERYLTQGKIEAAINEYKQVVENDSKDINSRNMLGDLYIKADDTQAAVNCYQEVAEHYNSQGFVKKAIAIYNKIYRIEPNSMEVGSKLADLYQTRGSYVKAKKHYEEIAKRYEEKGHKIEALAIWEKMAEIAPNDTEIYLKIAEAYWQNDRREDAAKAFVEAGNRLALLNKHESAVAAFSRSLEVDSSDLPTMKGFVNSQTALGFPEEGAKAIESILDKHQYDKELNYLLMDCYFEMGKPAMAEEVVLKLVEREPANYPKLLELVNVYLEDDDLDSAVKILSMTSEHLLVDGESEELLGILNEVLARNPEHLEALRLLARYYGWQRDEIELQQTLERLADSANINGEIEDERYALAQYILLVPHDVDRSNRLKEINIEYGFEEVVDDQLLNSNNEEIPTFESFATLNDDEDSSTEKENNVGEFEMINESDVIEDEDVVEKSQVFSEEPKSQDDEVLESESVSVISNQKDSSENVNDEAVKVELSASDEVRLENEIDSVKFYIEQGYTGLAEKSLAELTREFGRRKELVELLTQLPSSEQSPEDVVEEQHTKVSEAVNTSGTESNEESNLIQSEVVSEDTEQLDDNLTNVEVVKNEANTENENEEITENRSSSEKGFSTSFSDFKDELGLDDSEAPDQDDYEEHYQHAVVYQEMGMLEDAIREFQDAVNCIEPDDGSHRFLNCCTLIGHCFMQKGMPNLALSWFEKSLKVSDLSDKETLGVYYEIASALEANDERDKAINQFETIYSLDVDYRDVSERLDNLRAQVLTPA